MESSYSSAIDDIIYSSGGPGSKADQSAATSALSSLVMEEMEALRLHEERTYLALQDEQTKKASGQLSEKVSAGIAVTFFAKMQKKSV